MEKELSSECLALTVQCLNSIFSLGVEKFDTKTVLDFAQVSFRALSQPSRIVSLQVKASILLALSKLLSSPSAPIELINDAYHVLAPLFRQFIARDARLHLCACYRVFAEKNSDYSRVAHLITELNSFDAHRLGEPDFARRSSAFEQINEGCWSELSELEWKPLMFNMMFFIKDPEELALRNNSKYSLLRIIESGNAVNLIKESLLDGIKKGLRMPDEKFRRLYIDLLAQCAKFDILPNLKVLLFHGDEEADFFVNINHVQTQDAVVMCYEVFTLCQNILNSITEGAEDKETEKSKINGSLAARLEAAKESEMFFKVRLSSRDWYAAQNSSEQVDISVKYAKSNLHLLQSFAIESLRSVITSTTGGGTAASGKGLLTVANVKGIMPLILAGLQSNDEDLQISSLRLATTALRLPVQFNDGDDTIQVCGMRAYEFIESNPGTTNTICQNSLKFLTMLIRTRSEFELDNSAISYLLERLLPDIDEPERQSAVISFTRGSMIEHCSNWLKSFGKNNMLLRGGLEVAVMFEDLPSDVKTLHNDVVVKVLKSGIRDSDSDDSIDWQLIYLALDANMSDKMDLVEAILLYPHPWVRNKATRVFNTYFKSLDSPESKLELLEKSTRKFVRQLGAPKLTAEDSLNIVKNIVYTIKILEKNNSKTDNDEFYVDWIVRKLSSSIRTDIGSSDLVGGKTGCVQVLAAIPSVLTKETTQRVSYEAIRSIYVMTEQLTMENAHEELRGLGQEALNVYDQVLGTTEYLQYYTQAKTYVHDKRLERKSKRPNKSSIDKATTQVLKLCGEVFLIEVETKLDDAVVARVASGSGCNAVLNNRQSKSNCVFSGLKSEVHNALEILENSNPYACVSILIEQPVDLVEFILGKKQGKINKVVSGTGTVITTEKLHEDNFRLRLSGTNVSHILNALFLLEDELPAEKSLYIP
ncbi:hypothetical protein FF38_02838, partial [Lucilia cuprina]